jgi:hypothetical protein
MKALRGCSSQVTPSRGSKNGTSYYAGSVEFEHIDQDIGESLCRRTEGCYAFAVIQTGIKDGFKPMGYRMI